MKLKFHLPLIFMMVFFINAQATVHTVSNNVNSPGQYNNLQTCITAAANGDTVYVEPSPTNYGSISITKKLTIFGAGYDSRTYQINQLAQISTITFSKNGVISTPSGSTLISLYITGSVGVSQDTIFNVTISRCFVSGNISPMAGATAMGTNWVIVNNSIAGEVVFSYDYGNTLSNNIIYSFETYLLSGGNGTNLVSNNVFISNYGSGSIILQSYNVIYDNNIFYNLSTGAVTVLNVGNATGNVLNNNIAYSITGPVVPANNSGGNNILNQDPQFINPPALGGSGGSMNFANVVSYNFALPVTSPGHLAGTDGTDIGIYGGSYPWQNVAGTSALPQVIQFNILNSSIPLNGTLNVTATGVQRN